MKLIFDSATEYFEFLEMQQQVFGGAPARMVEGPSEPLSPAAEAAITEALEGACEAFAGMPYVQAAQPEQAADKPKRTRKPKASDTPMAEQPPSKWPSSPTLAEMQAADKPAEQPASEPAPVAIQPATDEQKAAFVADAQKHAGLIDLAKLAERVAALGVVDPAKHLTAARMFIARHQLPAYHQVQRDVELPDDIISYTDEQRTTHMAAMELFNEAHDQPKQ